MSDHLAYIEEVLTKLLANPKVKESPVLFNKVVHLQNSFDSINGQYLRATQSLEQVEHKVGNLEKIIKAVLSSNEFKDIEV